ncbi:MAG: hypothetical protein AAF220_05155 [Pseudomonadota bacterium]
MPPAPPPVGAGGTQPFRAGLPAQSLPGSNRAATGGSSATGARPVSTPALAAPPGSLLDVPQSMSRRALPDAALLSSKLPPLRFDRARLIRSDGVSAQWTVLQRSENYTVVRTEGQNGMFLFSSFVGPQRMNTQWYTTSRSGGRFVEEVRNVFPISARVDVSRMDGVETKDLSGHMEVVTRDTDGVRVGESVERKVQEALVETVTINGDRYLLRAFKIAINTTDGSGEFRRAEAVYVPVLGAAVRGTVPELDPTTVRRPGNQGRSALEAALSGGGGVAARPAAPAPSPTAAPAGAVPPSSGSTGGSSGLSLPSLGGGNSAPQGAPPPPAPTPSAPPQPASGGLAAGGGAGFGAPVTSDLSLPGSVAGKNVIVPGAQGGGSLRSFGLAGTEDQRPETEFGMRLPAPPPVSEDTGPSGPTLWKFEDIQVSNQVLEMIQAAALR